MGGGGSCDGKVPYGRVLGGAGIHGWFPVEGGGPSMEGLVLLFRGHLGLGDRLDPSRHCRGWRMRSGEVLEQGLAVSGDVKTHNAQKNAITGPASQYCQLRNLCSGAVVWVTAGAQKRTSLSGGSDASRGCVTGHAYTLLEWSYGIVIYYRGGAEQARDTMRMGCSPCVEGARQSRVSRTNTALPRCTMAC